MPVFACPCSHTQLSAIVAALTTALTTAIATAAARATARVFTSSSQANINLNFPANTANTVSLIVQLVQAHAALLEAQTRLVCV
eukprot:3788183-Pleurochrysis_carterae.AAC.1